MLRAGKPCVTSLAGELKLQQLCGVILQKEDAL